jgi:hypothetical protein
MKDTRVSPSAESIWTGDFVCKYNYNLGSSLPPPQQHAAHMLILSAEQRPCSIGIGKMKTFSMRCVSSTRAFEGAGLDPHPISQGGHNECFYAQHWNDEKYGGPKNDAQYYEADGKSYRVRNILAAEVTYSVLQLTREQGYHGQFSIRHEQDRRW